MRSAHLLLPLPQLPLLLPQQQLPLLPPLAQLPLPPLQRLLLARLPPSPKGLGTKCAALNKE